MVLSYSVGAVPGDKPFEAFGKDSGSVAQKAETRDDGPTGPATSNQQVNLLRPSVQLPAGICGWRALYGFRRLGKDWWAGFEDGRRRRVDAVPVGEHRTCTESPEVTESCSLFAAGAEFHPETICTGKGPLRSGPFRFRLCLLQFVCISYK